MKMSERGWVVKFADAFRGLWVAVRDDSSVRVHWPVAGAVIGTAAWLDVTCVEWCLLVLSIAAVLTAEMLNSAIESVARAVTREQDAHIGRGLDIAAGAVLLMSIGAATVGLIVFLPRLAAALSNGPAS